MSGPRADIRVLGVGGLAAPVLRAGTPLEVVAVFEKSFYCRDVSDRWLCFLREGLEPGPLHALCSDWPASLDECVSPGDILAPSGSGAMTAPGLRVRYGGMAEWRPPEFPRPDWPAIRRALPGWRAAILAAAPPETVAALFVGGGEPGEGWRRTAAEEAVRALAALSGWLAAPGGGAPRDAAVSLLGLGPGLTPTGDDILAGSLLTLYALGYEAERAALAAMVAELGPGATNRISLAHLRAAAAGQGAAPFHDALLALMHGGMLTNETFRRIAAIGHTSGWDVLIGVIATLEARVEYIIHNA